MKIDVITSEEVQKRLDEKKYPAQNAYLAMFSSWWGGIIKEPGHMLVPIDDHLVHRGDGVFEAIKVVAGKAFLMNEHLKRLESSAAEIALKLPYSKEEITDIISQTVRHAGVQDAMLRLYISRGPGAFTTNPYDSVGAQIYLIVTELKPLPAVKYEEGVKVGRSQVPPKEGWLATIKTCNYLPNVMMKKESVDRHLDFTVGFDSKNYLTESSTENMVIVDKDGHLVRPFLRQILKGTTMMRTFELAEALLGKGLIKGIKEADISEGDLIAAKEVMMIGTTLDVLPVTEYEGKPISNGKVGEVAKALLNLLREDIKTGPKATPLGKN